MCGHCPSCHVWPHGPVLGMMALGGRGNVTVTQPCIFVFGRSWWMKPAESVTSTQRSHVDTSINAKAQNVEWSPGTMCSSIQIVYVSAPAFCSHTDLLIKKKLTESINLMWASAPAVAALFWCLRKFCLDGNRLMHKCFSEWLHGCKNKHQRWWYTRMIEQSGLDTQALKLILDVLIIRKSLVKCVLLKSVTSNAISYSF